VGSSERQHGGGRCGATGIRREGVTVAEAGMTTQQPRYTMRRCRYNVTALIIPCNVQQRRRYETAREGGGVKRVEWWRDTAGRRRGGDMHASLPHRHDHTTTICNTGSSDRRQRPHRATTRAGQHAQTAANGPVANDCMMAAPPALGAAPPVAGASRAPPSLCIAAVML
jgi:hypothetical protein